MGPKRKEGNRGVERVGGYCTIEAPSTCGTCQTVSVQQSSTNSRLRLVSVDVISVHTSRLHKCLVHVLDVHLLYQYQGTCSGSTFIMLVHVLDLHLLRLVHALDIHMLYQYIFWIYIYYVSACSRSIFVLFSTCSGSTFVVFNTCSETTFVVFSTCSKCTLVVLSTCTESIFVVVLRYFETKLAVFSIGQDTADLYRQLVKCVFCATHN